MKKKICFLETSPTGPSDYHRKLFGNNPLCDWIHVTHDAPDSTALSFNKGFGWASNRNFLKEVVSKEYEYYAFIDWDLVFTSQTELDPIEQIIKDLDDCKPAVMFCYDPIKASYYGKMDTDFKQIFCSNNQMKIYHRSVLDWFFPGPVQFGEFWDMCWYNNYLEYPFKGHVICTNNVHCSGDSHDPRSTNKSPQSRRELFDYVQTFTIDRTLKEFKTFEEFKHYCISTLNGKDTILNHKIKDFSSLVHECFNVTKMIGK